MLFFQDTLSPLHTSLSPGCFSTCIMLQNRAIWNPNTVITKGRGARWLSRGVKTEDHFRLLQLADEGNNRSGKVGYQFHVLCLCFYPALNIRQLDFRLALFWRQYICWWKHWEFERSSSSWVSGNLKWPSSKEAWRIGWERHVDEELKRDARSDCGELSWGCHCMGRWHEPGLV